MPEIPQMPLFEELDAFDAMNVEIAAMVGVRDTMPEAHRTLYDRAIAGRTAVAAAWLDENPQVRSFYEMPDHRTDEELTAQESSLQVLDGYAQAGYLPIDEGQKVLDDQSALARARLIRERRAAEEIYMPAYIELYAKADDRDGAAWQSGSIRANELLVQDDEVPEETDITAMTVGPVGVTIPLPVSIEVVSSPDGVEPMTAEKAPEKNKETTEEKPKPGRSLTTEEVATLPELLHLDPLETAILRGGVQNLRLEEMRKDPKSPVYALTADEYDAFKMQNGRGGYRDVQESVSLRMTGKGLQTAWHITGKARGTRYELRVLDDTVPEGTEKSELTAMSSAGSEGGGNDNVLPATIDVADGEQLEVNARLDGAVAGAALQAEDDRHLVGIESGGRAAVTEAVLAERAMRIAETNGQRNAGRFVENLLAGMRALMPTRADGSLYINRGKITESVALGLGVEAEEAGRVIQELIDSGLVFNGLKKGSKIISFDQSVADSPSKANGPQEKAGGKSEKSNAILPSELDLTVKIMQHLIIDRGDVTRGDSTAEITRKIRGLSGYENVTDDEIKSICRRLGTKGYLTVVARSEIRGMKTGLKATPARRELKEEWLDPEFRQTMLEDWQTNTVESGQA